jgi:hypothetical protein
MLKAAEEVVSQKTKSAATDRRRTVASIREKVPVYRQNVNSLYCNNVIADIVNKQ